MKIIFAGGGTAGHINPAIAIADFINSRQNDIEILFIGTKHGLEKKLVQKSNYNIKFIDIQGFNRKSIFKNFITLKKIFTSMVHIRKIIKEFSPSVVIGTGGYVAGPVIFAAHFLKIKTIIHESNAKPGFTTKILSNFADATCLGFEKAKMFLNSKNIIVTGNPIRPSFFKISSRQAKEKLKLDSKPFILVFGGSLGSKRLNEAIINFIIKTKAQKNFQMLVGVGENADIESMRNYLLKSGVKLNDNSCIKIVKYIYDMNLAMNAADLIISRSGAMTVSEIIELKKPSILIPSPNVTNNHQEYNARVLSEANCAVMIKEGELSCEIFTAKVIEMLKPENAEKVKKNFDKFASHNALERIYEVFLKYIN